MPKDPGEGPQRSHEPVMVSEVLRFLGGRHRVLDMTVGAGGHAEALLRSGVGELIGIDRDPAAVEIASRRLARFGSSSALFVARFSEIPAVDPVDGVLYDLGVSSMQLDDPDRGFSFRMEGPLDMRMGREGRSARELINEASEEELAQVFWDFGQERRSRNVARAIVRARNRAPIETTAELASVVAGAVGRRRGGPHPARRTFQALRLAVNRELEELAASLPQASGLLTPGGRVLVISYHSLEDGIVKRYLKTEPSLDVLTKKPLRPSNEEATRNRRARSAKLRVAERMETGE
ncbi:MAG: 16S rRNA (cytosine(1402)-N(4))-methyltransferase RsmH [Actinomycetota bacterium]